MRACLPGDARHLATLDRRATRLLAEHGFPALLEAPAATPDVFAAFAERGWCRLAAAPSGLPVGYAVAAPLGDDLHLEEIAVDPPHGRKGIGSALLAAAIEHARHDGYSGMTLTTFRDVPFNAPFYAARGFREVPFETASQAVKARFLEEVPPGIDPATRVIMRRSV